MSATSRAGGESWVAALPRQWSGSFLEVPDQHVLGWREQLTGGSAPLESRPEVVAQRATRPVPEGPGPRSNELLLLTGAWDSTM
jgi:hypothetical protein